MYLIWMLKIRWTEKLTKKEMLVHANKARSILKMIWCRKRRWLGYVLRHDNLLHDIIEGKMLGRATPGRKKMEFLHDITERRDSIPGGYLAISDPKTRKIAKYEQMPGRGCIAFEAMHMCF